jgi:membrane protease YdiL (CAAX protease family)
LALLVLLRPIAAFRGGLFSAIGLHSPRHGLLALVVALVGGLGLWALGQLALRLIPATGESPVGAMVVWPSGSYAVALASVVSPVAEELFFRGFIYGAFQRRYGALFAFVATVVIFAGAHLPQTWGAWGGLVAIVVTGAGLTTLRYWTGSTVAPILAHLAHNSAITLGWVLVSAR